MGATLEATHRIDADLPAFDGHFPGAPVLPGACLLAIVLHHAQQQPALRAALAMPLQVQQVKFLAPVGPGQTLRIRFDAQGDAAAFSVHHGATTVARGRFASGAGGAATASSSGDGGAAAP